MTKDPVCGMQINENLPSVTSEYEGKTYYFCSEACKKQFKGNPENYSAKILEGGGGK